MKHNTAFLLVTFSVISALWLSSCAVVVGATAGASVVHDRRTAGVMIEDQSIELKAINRIASNQQLAEQVHINVTSFNRIVLISGEAPSAGLREEIGRIVTNIREVRSVHNEIVIAAPSSLMSRSSDTLITGKVKTTLITTDGVDATRIKVVTENGTVFLMGLSTSAHGSKAAEAASHVSGAQKIVKLFERIN